MQKRIFIKTRKNLHLIGTSELICGANQLAGFYMIRSEFLLDTISEEILVILHN